VPAGPFVAVATAVGRSAETALADATCSGIGGGGAGRVSTADVAVAAAVSAGCEGGLHVGVGPGGCLLTTTHRPKNRPNPNLPKPTRRLRPNRRRP
jgi:hypothetical protein